MTNKIFLFIMYSSKPRGSSLFELNQSNEERTLWNPFGWVTDSATSFRWGDLWHRGQIIDIYRWIPLDSVSLCVVRL